MDAKKVKEIMKLSQETPASTRPSTRTTSTHLSDLIKDENVVEALRGGLLDGPPGHPGRRAEESLAARDHIIKLRYGLNGEGPRTLEETGKLLGITRERVRQIQEKAIQKLKELKELSEYRGNF